MLLPTVLVNIFGFTHDGITLDITEDAYIFLVHELLAIAIAEAPVLVVWLVAVPVVSTE